MPGGRDRRGDPSNDLTREGIERTLGEHRASMERIAMSPEQAEAGRQRGAELRDRQTMTHVASGNGKTFVARQTGPGGFRWSVDYGGEQGVASRGSVNTARPEEEGVMSPRRMKKSMKQTAKRFTKGG